MIADVESKEIIGLATVREAQEAGHIERATIRVAEKGLIITLERADADAEAEQVLGAFRGGVRYFRSFDGAAGALRQAGIVQWDADVADWIPRTLRRGKKQA
ncbi:partition protein [Salmonella enterica subsp. enterica serovar Anatum]|nr:partition protein [Salmonella enterica subsp. enterica serovar Anatum]